MSEIKTDSNSSQQVEDSLTDEDLQGASGGWSFVEVKNTQNTINISNTTINGHGNNATQKNSTVGGDQSIGGNQIG